MNIQYTTKTVKELYDTLLKKYENIDFFHDFKMTYCLVDPNDIVFLATTETNKIVGICAIKKLNDLLFENLLVEVLENKKENFRNQGIAKKLIQNQFNYIKQLNSNLIEPNYTNLGQLFIKKHFDNNVLKIVEQPYKKPRIN